MRDLSQVRARVQFTIPAITSLRKQTDGHPLLRPVTSLARRRDNQQDTLSRCTSPARFDPVKPSDHSTHGLGRKQIHLTTEQARRSHEPEVLHRNTE